MAAKSKTKPSRTSPVEPIADKKTGIWPWIALGVVLLATAVIRIRLLSIPLERDEGEFAYMGQLMLQGIPPYKLAYNMKLPGTYAAYALMMSIFGQSIVGIHVALLLVNAASIVLVFLLTRKLLNDYAAVIAAATCAFLTLSQTVLGTSAHATQFVLPFALGGCLLLLKLRETDRPLTALWSGLLFGTAILMKQHSLFFPVFAVLWIIYVQCCKRPFPKKSLISQITLMTTGTIAPFVIVCFLAYLSGVFHNFWFWTFTYAREYVTEIKLAFGAEMFWMTFENIASASLLLWILAGCGLITTLIALFMDKARKPNLLFLIGFMLFSFLCVCPGLFFRNHYFILMMPAAAMMTGLALMYLEKWLSRLTIPVIGFTVPWVLFIIALGSAVNMHSDFLFRATPEQACRMMYGDNPFPEAIEIGNYIKKHSAKTDLVAIIGSEPEIYFYADRHSATGFIYTYGLMEVQPFALKMQKDMIKEITEAKPRFIIITTVPTSWCAHPASDLTILSWASEYTSKYYEIVGRSDAAIGGNPAVTLWGADARLIPPTTEYGTWVMERKPGT